MPFRSFYFLLAFCCFIPGAGAQTATKVFLKADTLNYLGMEFANGNMYVLSDLSYAYKKITCRL